MHYLFLFFAVVLETIGTTALNASQQFTRPGPTALMAVTYAASFYLMSLAMKVMPVGLVYAIWSGLGIVLITIIGAAYLGQKLDPAAMAGLGLIIAGILVINLLSGTTTH